MLYSLFHKNYMVFKANLSMGTQTFLICSYYEGKTCLLVNKDFHTNAYELKNNLLLIPRTNPVGMQMQCCFFVLTNFPLSAISFILLTGDSNRNETISKP